MRRAPASQPGLRKLAPGDRFHPLSYLIESGGTFDKIFCTRLSRFVVMHALPFVFYI